MRLLIALIVMLVVACGALSYLLVRERARTLAAQRNGLFIPHTLPTGDTLEHLVVRFEGIAGSALLGSRLARLYAVLFDPALVLPYIKDPYLRFQVEEDRIANNTLLFRCVAAVEQAVEGRTFGETPANTLGAYLRAEFNRRGWAWPTHPLVWKQFFLVHYVEQLFAESPR